MLLGPESLSEALHDPNWKQAMDNEFAVMRNTTWHLVPSSQVTNTIGCMWVYKVKRKAMDLLIIIRHDLS